MPDTEEINMVRTNLEMSSAMRERILAQARPDLRSFKPEIIALLDEALTARERRAARLPQGNPGGGSD